MPSVLLTDQVRRARAWLMDATTPICCAERTDQKAGSVVPQPQTES
jgi:hypothetical protein